MDRLEERASDDFLAGRSKITGGLKNEEIICEWQARGVHVRQLPDDEQGILRISVGGGNETPVPLNYLVFRGKHSQCVDLLRKALVALQEGPSDTN
jgi:hypothetical protein